MNSIDLFLSVLKCSEKDKLKYIFENYFNYKDQVYLKYYMKWYLGRTKQREISVLLNVSQPYVNKKFKKMIRDLEIILKFITTVNLIKILKISDGELSSRQKFVFHHMLMGNNLSNIARLTDTSRANISKIYKCVKKCMLKNKDDFKIVIDFFNEFYHL